MPPSACLENGSPGGMSISQISRALRNVGEFAMFAFIPSGLGKLTLLPEKTGSGKIGTPWARMQAAALR